jgi:Protein of unknown function (DUF1566)
MKPALGLFLVAVVVTTARVTEADAPPGHFVVGSGATAGTVFDTKTKLTWQQTAASSTYAWGDSQSVCGALTLDGGGWRQPTIAELVSLIDFSKASGPFIDTTAFPSTPSKLFWSATAVSGSTSTAWAVDFSNGFSTNTDSTSSGYVRCVR